MSHISIRPDVPKRLADDLCKSRITIRYTDEHGYEERTECQYVYLVLEPRLVGYDGNGQRVEIPLSAVESIDIDDEFTTRCHVDEDGTPVPQPVAVARYHRMKWGTLERFIPEGNA